MLIKYFIDGKRNGFSLLELLVVIVIMTVLMGVSGITFYQHSSDSADLRRGQRLVASIVEAARSEARASRCSVSLMLKTEKKRSSLAIAKGDESGDWHPIKRWMVLPILVESKHTSLDYPNAFVDTDKRLEFDAEGEVVTDEDGVYIFLGEREFEEGSLGMSDHARVYITKLTGKPILN